MGLPDHRGRSAKPSCWSPKKVWTPAVDADGGVRAGGDVAELTGLLRPDRQWPHGMRVIVRRERPHPGAQLSLFEERDGWRYQAFVTNTDHRAVGVPRGPSPCPCPGRGPDPARQGLRPGPVPVAGVRHQPGLVDRRPMIAADLIAWTAAARPDRRRWSTQLRTQSTALPVPARPRPADPQRTTTTCCGYPSPGPGPMTIVAVFANIAAIPQPA